MNPLIEKSSQPFEAIEFGTLSHEHFIPALDHAIKLANENIEKIKSQSEPNFENVIVAAETATDELNIVTETFYALYGAQCTDEISAIAEEFNNKLTGFYSDLSLDEGLFAKIKPIYENAESLNLDTEDKKILENMYLDMTRNGALLNDTDKEVLREIDQKMSKLELDYSENARNATNAYELIIEDESRLKGLPQSALDAAALSAKEKGHEGKWRFTLDFPSYFPLVQNCDDRELRAEIWKARSEVGAGGDFDNREIIKEIIKLRKERAKLLGYADHPSYTLSRRMAGNAKSVLGFLDNIFTKAKPFADKEFKKLQDLKEELTGDRDLRSYDGAYFSEKLRKKELDFDDEILRPYFKLENVLNGAFTVAEKLFGITFKERTDIATYHPEVKTYEVVDKNGEFVGLFYGDYFPRKEKRSGAWMTVFRNSGLQFGEVKRPFVCNVCNLTKPTEDKPSLLTLDEVRTIFHELGHGLHGLLSQTKYRSISGTNVYWDFVELPSQVLENWLTEKECLSLFAKHYETGEVIPDELIEKVKQSGQFLEGMATVRQLWLGNLDMAWHLADPESVSDVREFEKQATEKFQIYPLEAGGIVSTNFGHIFSGGYSSGYYSYKWAEVLDADAFAYFKENGIFNAEIGQKFKQEILEKGGSEDPMVLYKRFRGAEPNPDALMERCGFA